MSLHEYVSKHLMIATCPHVHMSTVQLLRHFSHQTSLTRGGCWQSKPDQHIRLFTIDTDDETHTYFLAALSSSRSLVVRWSVRPSVGRSPL